MVATNGAKAVRVWVGRTAGRSPWTVLFPLGDTATDTIVISRRFRTRKEARAFRRAFADKYRRSPQRAWYWLGTSIRPDERNWMFGKLRSAAEELGRAPMSLQMVANGILAMKIASVVGRLPVLEMSSSPPTARSG